MAGGGALECARLTTLARDHPRAHAAVTPVMAMPQHAMRAARPGTARPLPARVQHAGAPAQPQGRSPLHVCFAAAREPLSAKARALGRCVAAGSVRLELRVV